jgi:prevent-host-death family protein
MSVKIVPISDLRRKSSQILEILQEEENDVYITHYGRPVAVMVDYERYEDLLTHVAELTQRLRQKANAANAIEDYTAHLAGLHCEVWEGIDTDNYLQDERDAWEN